MWGESWMYSPVNYGNTVRTLATMAEYINHIEDAFELDNIMALELLNEPWAFLVSGAGILIEREFGGVSVNFAVH